MIYELFSRFFQGSRKREIDELRSQLEQAVTFGVNYRMAVNIPSTGQDSIIAMSYTLSKPPRIRVETAWSQREALKPEFQGRKYAEFNEGDRYLEDIFTEEVIGIIEKKLAPGKSQEIRRNLRKPKN